MRFRRCFTAQKASTLYPELVARFPDPTKRGGLFLDWFKGNEDVQEVQLIHKRRLIQENKAESIYQKLTKTGLMKHFHHDEEYVEMVIQQCKKRKLFSTKNTSSTGSWRRKTSRCRRLSKWRLELKGRHWSLMEWRSLA